MSVRNSLDFFVQWHLTERCNLRCRHCYQTGERTTELSFAEIVEILDEVGETVADWSRLYGIDLPLSYTLTGGEPFLRPDFFAILEDVRRRGHEVSLLSNGTLVDRATAERLAGLGVRGVQVSLEGPREIHEAIRGPESFQRALGGARHLADAGIPVTLNVTLSELNAGTFPQMIPLAVSVGARRLGFSRLVPAGRGLGLADRMLGPERVREIYEHVFALDSQGIEIVTGDPLAGCLRDPRDQAAGGAVPVGGCAAGFSGITIAPDGTLYPCRRLPIPVGNLRTDSFREVWAASPVLNDLRDKSRYRGRCGRCDRWDVCRGCRAIAWAAGAARGERDHLAEDPQCFR